MAELDTRMPQWLVERQRAHWTQDESVSRDVQAGFQMGLRQQQINLEKRQFLLQAAAAASNEKLKQVQTENALLELNEKTMFMDDLRTIKAYQKQYMAGASQDEPPLQTFDGLRMWKQWRSLFSAENSEQAEFESFLADYSKLDGIGKAHVRATSPEWPVKRGRIPTDAYLALGVHQQRIREEALSLKSQWRTVEVDGTKYLQSSTGGLHPVPKNWAGDVRAVEITDDDGNVLANAIPNSRGGLTVLRPQTQKRHPLQTSLDRLEAKLEAAKADKYRKDQVPGLEAEANALRQTIAADEAQQPSGTSTTPTKDPLGLFK